MPSAARSARAPGSTNLANKNRLLVPQNQEAQAGGSLFKRTCVRNSGWLLIQLHRFASIVLILRNVEAIQVDVV